jgi:hypothetical protein
MARWGRDGMHQNFCRETWEKISTWKTKKEMENNIKMKPRERVFVSRRWLELPQDCVQWQGVVLAVVPKS